MVAQIRQIVKVEPGGVVRLRSSKLKTGARAEVIVRSPPPVTARAKTTRQKPNSAKTKASARRVPTARMTAEVRGDIAWAKKIRSDPTEVPMPYDRARTRLGL